MKPLHRFSILPFALAVATACGSSSPAPSPDAGMTADPNTVTTTSGTVHGSATATVRSFKGVPYAQPPVGPLRWAAPQAATASTTTIDATAFGKHCPQPPTPFGNANNTDESCLFLNVFAPASATATSALPVMVWFHGGALLVGETDEYDPTPLVTQGVIVVTVNYRLGLLGFMSHASLTAEQGGSSGNYGLMDQQLALHWVQDNVANFGGDKTKVTIFGESAGGLSVHSHLVSPGSAGLFSKAIIESGAYGNATQPSLATEETAGQAFAAGAGCTSSPCSVADLRGLQVTKLITVQAAVSTWVPALDGKVFSKTQGIGAALTAGNFAKVPVLEGSNHDEYRLFVGLDEYTPKADGSLPGAIPNTPDGYTAAVEGVFGVTKDANGNVTGPSQVSAFVLSQYQMANYQNNASLALATAGTDLVFACNSRVSSAAISSATGAKATFLYEFADESAPELYLPPSAGLGALGYGAAHASEIQYIFTVPPGTGISAPALTADQKTLATTMQTYWANFAKNGDPNGGSLANWPAYTKAADTVMSFAPGTVAAVTTFGSNHKCAPLQ